MAIYMQTVYDRIPTGGVEDVAVTTHDFHLDPALELDLTRAQAIAAAYNTFITALADRIANNVSVREYRFYDDYNGDGSPGQVDFVVPGAAAGGSTNPMLPPQCCCTVTEGIGIGVAGRKFWGRFYLPGFSTATLVDDGRFGDATTNAVADAAQALYNTWIDGTTQYPIVWTKQGPTPPLAVPVSFIRVDNVVDIQRRRRWDVATLRATRDVEDVP